MKILMRLLKFTRQDWPNFIIATVSVLVITGFNLWIPMIIKQILALIGDGQSPDALLGITRSGLMLLGAYLGRTVCQFLQRYYSHVGGWSLVARMRQKTYDHIQKLSLRFFQDKPTGQLMSRMISDTANMETLTAHALPDMLSNTLLLIGVTVLVFSLNATLACYALIPIPLLIFALFRFNTKIRPALRKVQATLGDLSALVQDNLSGIKEIQLFTQEPHESERVGGSVWKYTNGMLASLKKTAFYHPLFEFLTSIGTLLVVWLGARQIMIHGTMEAETLVAFILYLGMFYTPVTTLGRIVEEIQTTLAGAERVFEILDTDPDVADSPGASAMPKVKGAIQFDNVSFAYRKDVPVLEHINFAVAPGSSLALVGPTGVGKTTIASLIPRFYDPTAGRVLFDGVDIKTITMESLRSQISLVLQDVFLFNGTVADNILYGAPQADEAAMKRAAEQAHAYEFISQLPEGFDTRIGERGVKLSGGQKQRLAIARAILRDTPILILDEATSAVDSETETEIQAALRELMRGRTTIIIAHRLSTVREADQILVLSDGRIAEIGKHQELLRKGGLYSKLYHIQFKNAPEPPEILEHVELAGGRG